MTLTYEIAGEIDESFLGLLNVARFVEADESSIIASFAVNLDAPLDPSFSLPAVSGGTVAVNLDGDASIASLLLVEFAAASTYNVYASAEAVSTLANN